jgi:hypothetical protein
MKVEELVRPLADARAVEPLIARLCDANSLVCWAACQALGKLGDARAVEPLIGRLGDGDALVRQAACWALGRLGDERAVEPLLGCLVDVAVEVRRAAYRVLGPRGWGRCLARAALDAAEGKVDGITELGRLAAAGGRHARLLLGTAVADCVAQCDERPRKRAFKALLEALKPWLGEMLCSVCLARMHPDRPTCPVCDRAAKLVFGVREVVAVLDGSWGEERALAEGVLRVNWLQRRTLFDFDRVEIVAAADEEVERFLIAVGNDTDEYRQPRYRQMPCRVSRQCALSENTLRILRRTVGEVVRSGHEG